MSETEWPLAVRLNPAVVGLDSLVFPAPKYAQSAAVPPLSRQADVQQRQLAADILCVLNGGEGDYIKFVATFDPQVLDDKLRGPNYKVPTGVDAGLRDVLTLLAEAGGAAYAVRTFADHFTGIEYGKVNQALSSAFRVLHKLFLLRVSEIEAAAYQSSSDEFSIPSAEESAAAAEPTEADPPGDSASDGSSADGVGTLFAMWVKLEPIAVHLGHARQLIARFVEETRFARDRKRRHGALDLVERASTAYFVDHDEKEAVIELRGGAVLRNIAEIMRREMGDAEASNLYEELIAAASKPYLRILSKWLSCGELDDPFEEFLIQETHAFKVGPAENLDDYWDKRFTVRAMALPLQLSTPRVYNMLLVSGKYLNVIRSVEEEGQQEMLNIQDLLAPHDTVPHEKEIQDECQKPEGDAGIELDLEQKCHSIEDPQVVDAIVQAYKRANTALLHLFSSPPVYNLNALLQKLNDVFFMRDTFDGFRAGVRAELEKPASQIREDVLVKAISLIRDPDDPWSQYLQVTVAPQPLKESLLAVIAVESDSERRNAGGNPYDATAAANNNTNNNNSSGTDKLTGYEVVQFDFSVPFPLNLVVSRRSIMRYQYLFRHLLELRNAAEMLGESWLAQAKDPRLKMSWTDGHLYQSRGEVEEAAVQCLIRASLLRQRMLQLVTDLLHHSMVDGIQYEHQQLVSELEGLTEVSELVDAHTRFLDRALMNCLLSDTQLLKVQTRLLALCRQFVRFISTNADAMAFFMSWSRSGEQRTPPLIDDTGKDIRKEEVIQWFNQTLERYEHAFDRNVQKLHGFLERFVPTSFAAGAATIYLIHQLQPLLPHV